MTLGENTDLPVQHVAIIMDGNGRWAQQRGRSRAFGHSQGVETVRTVVRAAGDFGIKYLTLFGFSTENWRRPSHEVDALFDLMKRFVDADLEKLHAEGVKIRIAGRRDGLDRDLVDIIERAEQRTQDNRSRYLTIAFNYGGRDEIVRAARRMARDITEGHLDPESVDEQAFAAYLDTAGIPDPDLVIRTSGEHRTSNFLIWQAAYAELVFMDVLWPDFAVRHFESALEQFAARKRRFGGVNAA